MYIEWRGIKNWVMRKFIFLLYVVSHLHYSEGKQGNPRLRLVIPNKGRQSSAKSLPHPNNFDSNQWQGREVPETGIFNIIYDFISMVMSKENANEYLHFVHWVCT